MKFTKITLAVAMSLVTMVAVAQKFEGLAMTPPMGWNSWNKFACDVSEKLIKETADVRFVSITPLYRARQAFLHFPKCF